MFDWLFQLIEVSIEFLNGIVGSYGLAIVIFTVIIKMLLLPLTLKQTKSMKAMKELQPEMEKIKSKYEDNKEKQQEAMMKLYQENNVNPIAGCLPMILQMAIIIPLYRTILAMSDAFGDEVFLWIGRITEGSLAEPDIPLVILNGLVMVIQTKFTSGMSGGDGKASMMMWIMPIMVVFIGFSLPAGIMIYWLTSTVIIVGQHFFIHRQDEEPETAVKEA